MPARPVVGSAARREGPVEWPPARERARRVGTGTGRGASRSLQAAAAKRVARMSARESWGDNHIHRQRPALIRYLARRPQLERARCHAAAAPR